VRVKAERLDRLLRRISQDIDARPTPHDMRTKIVGVDGAGGSGKSTFAEHLASALGGVQVVWNPAEPPSRVEVAPASHLIIEGVTATRAAFKPYLTYSIWIETHRDVRLDRGLLRDGDDARAQWERWMAEEDAYVQRERPDERADLVVDGGRDLWR
jgi:uridine kinase